MKIAQVTTFFHPVTGGVETHVMELSEALLKRGYSVTVLTSDSNKSGPRISEKETKFLGVPVKRFRNYFNLSYYHKVFPGIFWHVLKSDYDVVHVHGYRKTEYYFVLFAKILGRKSFKLFLTGHNPFATTSFSYSKMQKVLLSLHDKTVGRWFINNTDKVIALVKKEQDTYINKLGLKQNKVSVIPNGVDEIFFEKIDSTNIYKDLNIELKKWNSVAVFVGRINKAKGIQNLINAVKENKKVLFLIVGGDDGYLDKLKILFSDLKNIYFTERFLPPKAVAEVFSVADMFVFPSFHEAFGIVLLEAMASSLPVVSTNVGGPSEIVKPKFGYLINPTDYQEWSKIIKELDLNPKLRKQLGENGRISAQKYRWVNVSREIVKLYEEGFTQ